MADPVVDKRTSRKERELAFRVDLVLDAALEVFMSQPFAEARIEDIAQRAELSVGTLYNLFDSKEQIYKAAVSRQQSRFFDRANAYLDRTDDPTEQLHEFIRAFFDHVAENFAAWRFHVYASAGLSATVRNELSAEVAADSRVFLGRLIGICQAGIGTGAFRAGIDPLLMAVAIHSVPHSFLGIPFQNNDPNVMPLIPKATEAVKRIVGADVDDA